MSHHVQRLTAIETMLATTARRYPLAVRRLAEVEPGYPANTPGCGEPGAGKGFTTGSTTERLAHRPHPELDKAAYIAQAPYTIANTITVIAAPLNIPRPSHHQSPRYRRDLLVWSWWTTRQLLEHPDIIRSRDLAQLDRQVAALHQTVTTWGTKSAKPKKADLDPSPYPEDLTGLWCRNCLGAGTREPRWRGDLCRWCYEFHRGEGFLPPAALLRIRQAKPRVTQRDVEPFIRAFREQNKKRKRRAS